MSFAHIMQHGADHEKSGTKNKTPSTPLADAVAKVERALRENGMTLESVKAHDSGLGVDQVHAVIAIN